MSVVIKTVTPFLEKSLLLKALEAVACQYQEQGEEIIIPSLRGFGRQTYFIKDSLGRFTLSHDSHTSVRELLKKLEPQYKLAYQKKMEELEQQRLQAEREKIEKERRRVEAEKLRLEQEKKQFVEKQKEMIKERAQKMGYQVQEQKKGNKVQLVLVRRTY